jgi:hypothetical protein
MEQPRKLILDIPEKLGFLVSAKSRYKILYGGRGAAKSETIAKCLLALGYQNPIGILCAREIQNTIKDSVHKLLAAKIKELGLEHFYAVTETDIRGANGSFFVFKGLRSNIGEIKSLFGIKYCWVEEAHLVKKETWEILEPTIRENDSEIWISFNTGSDSDYVYEEFVVKPREDAICVKINYYDNPWFPDVLRKDMERDKKHNPERYNHVWLGEPGYEGKFFTEFTEQLEEPPFYIQISASQGRLIGSLDSGVSHATVFYLFYIDDKLDPHLLLTVRTQGVSIQASAEEIYERLDSFPLTYGAFPDVIVYDNQMDNSARLDDNNEQSPIGIYKNIFRKSNRLVRWEPANKRKENGCQIIKMLFTGTSDMTPLRYFKGYNQSFVDGIQRVVVDPNNKEVYLKQDGDDEADSFRYGAVKLFSVRSLLTLRKGNSAPKTHLERLLGNKNKMQPAMAGDWYNS